jgi:hypothetical protein
MPRHTEDLVHLLDSRTLWTEYGIDDDIIVSPSIGFSPSASDLSLLICLQPFTSDFPRADIYEMISPDLLHQLIKGTFKDHLVTWVCQYLVAKHGERNANVILDDIDRRYYGALTTKGNSSSNTPIALLQFHLSQASVDFLKAGALSNGQEMTQRP